MELPQLWDGDFLHPAVNPAPRPQREFRWPAQSHPWLGSSACTPQKPNLSGPEKNGLENM